MTDENHHGDMRHNHQTSAKTCQVFEGQKQTEQNMNFKNKILLGIASILLLSVFGCYGYLVYDKVSKTKWLSNLDVTAFLIETNDLPAGYTPGIIKNIEPNDYNKFVQAKEQEIIAPDGSIAGTVSVYLFSLKNEQDEMYNFLSLMETPEGMIPLDLPEIGESRLAAIDPFDFIVFTRCTAIGYIQVEKLQPNYGVDYLIAHAKRLDEKLKSIACEQP